MSINASELISKHKFKILSGATLVAGSAAAAGTYFMPKSQIENSMANSPPADISEISIVQKKDITEDKKVEQDKEVEKPSDEIKVVSAPVEPTTPAVIENTSPKSFPEAPATNNITTIKSAEKPTETDEIVQYQEGEFGNGTWNSMEMEAIPYNAPLSEWKDKENSIITTNTNMQDGSLLVNSFKIPEFETAIKKIVEQRNESSRDGSILKTVCTKHYQVKISDLTSTDKEKKERADEIAGWCGRRRAGLTE